LSALRTTVDPQLWLDQTLCTIGTLFDSGDVIEIRALNVGRTENRAGSVRSGYFEFEDSDAISAAIRSLDGKAEGVYVVLNRFNPDLLARSANRLQARPKQTTSDADIVERRWLYIDVDAIRPAGISATEEEHTMALQKVETIRQFLDERGWPEPIIANSGNGGHLLYRLPELDLGRAGDLVKQCLKALSARFSDSIVKVDESTSNAARLCRLYGTMTQKGDSTPDRPHRRSALLETPERIAPVSKEALEALASQVLAAASAGTVTKPAASAPGAFNIDAWLVDSGLDVIKGPDAYKGGRRWTLRNCPFNGEHEKPVVIELASGALAFTCPHRSCAENNWQALRRYVEPDYRESTQAPRLLAGAAATPPKSTNENSLITDLSQIPSVFSFESQLDWCVDGMIARGSVTLICAESGTGKTWFGYYLAGRVAHGVPMLDRSTHPCKVLYLDGENPLYVVKQRLRDLGILETPSLIVWGGWLTSPPVGPDDPLVIEFAREHQGLIVFDSLIEFHPGSEQSSTETRAFMRRFRLLANVGATVVILHHTGKAETSKLYRGSSDIKAAVDTAYLLVPGSQEPDELGALSMTYFKARLAPGQNFGMKFVRGQGFLSGEPFKPIKSLEEAIEEILGANPDSNQTEIVRLAQGAGFARGRVEASLKTGPWVKRPGPKNSTLYNLRTERLDAHESSI
jgi:hypothetical protein